MFRVDVLDCREITAGPSRDMREPASMYTRIDIVAGGEALYLDGASRRQLLAGHLYLFPPEQPVHIRQSVQRPYHAYSFRAAVLPSPPGTTVFSIPIPRRGAFHALTTVLAEAARKRNRELAGRLLESTLILINGQARFIPVREDAFSDMLRYLVANFASDLSVRTLADIAGLHPNSFMRRFKKEFGMPVKHYIDMLRLQQAKMLLHANGSIRDAAMQSGFSNVKSFTRFFSARVRVSPGAYRRLNRPPVIAIPRVPKVTGGFAGVPWDRGISLTRWYPVFESPGHTPLSLSGRMLHDGVSIYVALEERVPTAILTSSATIFQGDAWELFFSSARSQPYRQVQIAPDGRSDWVTYTTAGRKRWDVIKTIAVDTRPNRWRIMAAVPLNAIADGIASGSSVYGNIFRHSLSGPHYALCPTFSFSFNVPARFVTFVLKK
ncbi:MAG: helix-turn-helix domain-containing protein [Spirochaetes bacterium]|nr:helix-turn-helix domain-containing protein [Spirochaetota bacterium]